MNIYRMIAIIDDLSFDLRNYVLRYKRRKEEGKATKRVENLILRRIVSMRQILEWLEEEIKYDSTK